MSLPSISVRWQDIVAKHLPTPLRDSGVPIEYFVIVPTTILLALALAYSLITRSSSRQRLEQAHTVSAASFSSDTKRSSGKAPTVLLVGLQDSGKTSLFSALVYRTVPPTLPSQVLSQGQVELAQAEKPTNLIDLPGHPRLRPLLADHVPQADALVICIDAVMAAKAGAGLSKPGEGEELTDAADLVHSTLTALARNRQRTNAPPPSVLVLFTRSDLSPLLSNSDVDTSKDEKRRAQLLSRCRSALETELGRRRAGMGLGRRHARVRIAGVGKVVDGTDGSSAASVSIFGWIRRALGLSNSSTGVQTGDDHDEEDEEEDALVDYIDWNASQRQSDGAAVSAFSLERLDEDVVYAGKVDWALASTGKQRGWTGSDAHDGTAERQAWLENLQQP